MKPNNSSPRPAREPKAIKQVAIAKAMKLPMPEHLAAIRKAERDFHLALAAACDRTEGLIDGSAFRRAAAAV